MKHTPVATAAEVRARALALGFDQVGITTAEPPPHADGYQQWLADGFHGDMAYMARTAAKRIDPRRVLPEAKSIIVVSMNYNPGTSQPIARYAQADRDYHEVMGEKLAELAGFAQGVWYVDTGPILERDIAQRAGIGWVGKHTNLLNRKFGNWLFIGEVLTKLVLQPDEPARGHCGSCVRCLRACPTGAIVAPYRLDARRCISYLTIELKGPIPVELRPAIGNRIFGCDECLKVCPWNRFARPAMTPRSLPSPVEFLTWDEGQFSDFFRGTPIHRLGRARFLRNVCVSLGNTRERFALPQLTRVCLDPDPMVREHAQWAVAQISARPA